MPEEINPYQPPSSEEPPAKVSVPRRSHWGWEVAILVGISAVGVISIAPWLPLLAIMFSTPVFFRLARGWEANPVGSPSTLWSVLGYTGTILSIFCASIGMFWGTCTAGAWTGFALQSDMLMYVLGFGSGTIVGIVTFAWLISRCFFPRAVSEQPTPDSH